MKASPTPQLEYPTPYPVQLFWLECIGFRVRDCYQGHLTLEHDEGYEVDINYKARSAIFSKSEEILAITKITIPHMNEFFQKIIQS